MEIVCYEIWLDVCCVVRLPVQGRTTEESVTVSRAEFSENFEASHSLYKAGGVLFVVVFSL